MKKYNELFGQKITVNHRLVRDKEYIKGSYNETNNTWKKKPYSADVIIIGKRQLSDVVAQYSDTGVGYNVIQSYPALLVVENMNTNPFYIKYKENDLELQINGTA